MNRDKHVVKNQRGFTLIELIVVVAIIAIIAGIAVSSFRGAGDDANRARGMADITALNDAMGRYYQTSYTYIGATLPVLTAAAGLSLTNQYMFNVVVVDAQTYSIRAQPTTSGTLLGDGALSIDQTGRRCFYPGSDNPSWTGCPSPF